MAQADFTRIASNIGALNSLWALQGINKQLGVHQARLSTGKRINSAADDPAGLTIATKLMSRSEGLKVATDNIGDGKNLLAVAEAGVGRITDIIIDMKKAAQKAGSDTLGASERSAIYEQLKAYTQQIDDIVTQTDWNGTKLIDGSFDTNSLTFLTGASSADTTAVNGLKNLRATAGGTGTGLDLATVTGGSYSVSLPVEIGDPLNGAVTSVAVSNNNLTQAAAGGYTIQITGNTATAKIELFNSAGVAQMIDTLGTGVATTAVALSATTDLTAGKAWNFGNGLTVTLNARAAATNASGSVNLTNSGSTYGVSDQGATGTSLDPTTTGTAALYRNYMAYLETKLTTVTGVMSKIGAFTGRLTFKEDQVAAAQINVEASYNRIMNANMAEEQVNASKFLVLQQTSMAMLAQTNQSPQTLLSLFR